MNKEEILNQKEQYENDVDKMIREVAEEENMSYEEVKEVWEAFKDARKKPKNRTATKKKVDKDDNKKKRKEAKKARRKNRK